MGPEMKYKLEFFSKHEYISLLLYLKHRTPYRHDARFGTVEIETAGSASSLESGSNAQALTVPLWLDRSICASPRGGISSSFTMNYSLLSPLSLPVRSSITCWRCVCDENQTLNEALRRRALMLLPFELQIKCADWTRLRRHRHFNAQLHSFNCFLNVHLILAMENHLCLNAENLSLSKHTICQ